MRITFLGPSRIATPLHDLVARMHDRLATETHGRASSWLEVAP